MLRPLGRASRWTGAATLLLAAGCQSYEARPLDPAQLIETVDAARRVESPAERVALADAVALAESHSPTLREAVAADAAARVVADIPAPLPNPSLSVAPTYLADSDVSGGKKWGFEVAGGWLLDLAGVRAATNDLHEAEAIAAHVDAAATRRETYLAIRRGFTELATAGRRRAELTAVEEAAQSSLAMTHRLVEAAQATALDTYELDVEAQRAAAATLEAREIEGDARALLSELVGVEARAFTTVETPDAPGAPPSRDALLALVVASHPTLDRLRAEYDVSEVRLQREILKQYPGLELGPGFEREEDVDKYSLGLGIEVPLFDRNQIGIAEAEQGRELVRVRYESEVARRITAVDAALERLALRRARLSLLTERAAPAAAKALRMAEQGLRSGVIGALRYLVVARAERAVRLDRIDAEQAVLEAWCDLEGATGAPLLRFPSTSVEGAKRAAEGEAR